MISKNYEFKFSDLNEDEGTFSGIGNKTNFKDYADDIVEKGAFKKSLTKKKPLLLWQHDMSSPIGLFTDIKETDEGLVVKGKLLINDIQKAKEAHALIKAGAISGLSIGFSIPSGGAEMKSDGTRIIKEVDLHEVSIVSAPCNALSTISSVKSVTDMTEREFEKSLRDVVGLSKKEAKALMSGGYKAMSRDDSEQEEKTNNLSEVLNYFKNK